MMSSDATRQLLKDHPNPREKLTEMQNQGWDTLGVNRGNGCKALNDGCKSLEDLSPQSDASLVQAKREFVLVASRTFIKALEDKKPATLQTSGPISREKMLGMLEACLLKLNLPETQVAMQQYVVKTRKPPMPVVIALQRDMLEIFGIEINHGCTQLSNVCKDYPDDKELHQRMTMWMDRCELYNRLIWHRVAKALMEQDMRTFCDIPERKEETEKARKRLETMSLEEQEAHVQTMNPKFEGLQRVKHLSQEKQQEEMKKLEVDEGDLILFSLIVQNQVTSRASEGLHAM